MKDIKIKSNKYEQILNLNQPIKNSYFTNIKRSNCSIISFLNSAIIAFLLVNSIINKNKIKILFNYNSKNTINQINNKKLIEKINNNYKSIIRQSNEIKNDLIGIKEQIEKIKSIIFKNKLKNKLDKEQNINNDKNNIIYSKIDKDMIGIKYPEIKFDNIKSKIINNKLISSLILFLEQLEVKLIYLEKEINVTKLYSFYTSRTLYLKEKGIYYDDSNLTELHNIVSWLVIHKSTQLKGIASDKYLACKYVKIKLGVNLCKQRIAVYNNVEEIKFDEIIKLGDVILKVSNGCHDNVFIYKNKKNNIEIIKQKIKKAFSRDFALVVPEFFHLYSKKRIILEKTFYPLTDLYEFKFYIVNREIKIIYIRVVINHNVFRYYYDSNFNYLEGPKNYSLNISIFDKNSLEQLKDYAYKLSEDFPNFIRVDLYLFHNKIFLSELTFDPRDGHPFLRNSEIIRNAGKNYKRVD